MRPFGHATKSQPRPARRSERRSRTASGASIDTRTLAPGDLYFAIKGDVHDGHDFVEAALEQGRCSRRRLRGEGFLLSQGPTG